MVTRNSGLCTGSAPGLSERIRLIVEFWNELRVCDELGATNWGVLEPLERRVTEALNQKPQDLATADALTALAKHWWCPRKDGLT